MKFDVRQVYQSNWDRHLRSMVRWYITFSYAYYVRDHSFIPDWQYDALCKYLAERWCSISEDDKKGVTLDGLKCGTGHHLDFAQFPIARSYVDSLLS